MSTLYEAHEHDQWIEKSEDDLNTISIDEISDLFQQADDFGIRDVHPSVGKLDIIAKRYDVIKKNFIWYDRLWCYRNPRWIDYCWCKIKNKKKAISSIIKLE